MVVGHAFFSSQQTKGGEIRELLADALRMLGLFSRQKIVVLSGLIALKICPNIRSGYAYAATPAMFPGLVYTLQFTAWSSHRVKYSDFYEVHVRSTIRAHSLMECRSGRMYVDG